MALTLDDRITDRIKSADYRDWRATMERLGGCARPIHLTGSYSLVDGTTGHLLHEHDGRVLVPCGNRRASVCLTCSDRYAADAFHLVRAGLSGGSKGVPETVTGHPRLFVTLTAPSFGTVHNRALTRSGKVRRCPCGQAHHQYDTRVGSPVDPEGYDYVGSVLWQAHTGKLWAEFTRRVLRACARLAGLTVRELRDVVRLSYGKVAEYQIRGLIHFHAVVRLDGPDGPDTAPPSWATAELLTEAVQVATVDSEVTTHRPDGQPLQLAWGTQLDIRPISAVDIDDEAGGISEPKLAAYVAKYATKGTGKSDSPDRPIRSQLDIDHLRVSEHYRRIIQTAWDLGGLAEYEKLKLRHWAHMLAFRGHFLTKSRSYSTTFRQIREDRRGFRLRQLLTAADLDPDTTLLINDWSFASAGHRNDAEAELAAGIAERVRLQRTHQYWKEHDYDTAAAA
nr:replication initiator [Kibdelosporangium sp. MJ126-NF4]